MIQYKEHNILISVCKGKMLHIPSINSYRGNNTFCLKMAKNKDSICKYCYSINPLKYRKNMREAYIKTDTILSKSIIKEFPILPFLYFRFNSHGELINNTHFINYCNIAKNNSKTNFTLWTKRKNIIQKNYRYIPKNLIIIYSNPLINPKLIEIPKYFDKVFNVYTEEFVNKNTININCQKHCFACLKCYTKNKIKYINEIIK